MTLSRVEFLTRAPSTVSLASTRGRYFYSRRELRDGPRLALRVAKAPFVGEAGAGVLCGLGKQLLVVSARSPRVSRGEAGLGVLGGWSPGLWCLLPLSMRLTRSHQADPYGEGLRSFLLSC